MKLNLGCGGIILGFILLGFLMMFGCKQGCADAKKISVQVIVDSTTVDTTINFEPCGIFDKDEIQNEKIKYEVCWGNVIWSCIFVETIIVPIQYIGYYLWEPVGLKEEQQKIKIK